MSAVRPLQHWIAVPRLHWYHIGLLHSAANSSTMGSLTKSLMCSSLFRPCQLISTCRVLLLPVFGSTIGQLLSMFQLSIQVWWTFSWQEGAWSWYAMDEMNNFYQCWKIITVELARNSDHTDAHQTVYTNKIHRCNICRRRTPKNVARECKIWSRPILCTIHRIRIYKH